MEEEQIKAATLKDFFSKAKERPDSNPPKDLTYKEMNPVQKKAKRKEMKSVGIQKKREYALKKKFGLRPHDNEDKLCHSELCGRKGARSKLVKLKRIEILLNTT